MKDVVGYEGLYAIDEEGNVFNARTHKKRKLVNHAQGYKMIGLSAHGKIKKFYVHRLMAEAYLPNFSEELQVDHIDRDKTNNSISNLRMVTPSENKTNNNAKGYHFCSREGKWLARIKKHNRLHHLGYFDNEVDARNAYLSAKSSLHTFTYDAGRIVSSSKKHE